MKIKHFTGYGCVNAVKIYNENNILIVKVTGNHEQGLNCYRDWDTLLLFNWIVKRFDKTRKSDAEIDKVVYQEGFERNEAKRTDEEYAIYTIRFRNAA